MHRDREDWTLGDGVMSITDCLTTCTEAVDFFIGGGIGISLSELSLEDIFITRFSRD